MRQQKYESNYEMVNMLTQQIIIVFHPLIQNTTQSYQQLARQMGRIIDFCGAPEALVIPLPNNQVHIEQPLPSVVEGNQGQNGPEVVFVQRNQDAEQVLRNVQQNNLEEKQYN